MMRFQSALSSALAAVLVPAAVYGTGDLQSLEELLRETERALEVLAGIRDQAAAGQPSAVSYVRAVTEAPILEPRVRDERLVDLRNQVNLLQTELDVLQAPALASGAAASGPAGPPEGADGSGPARAGGITTGLSRSVLRELAGGGADEAQDGEEPRTERAPAHPEPLPGAEPGYSADPVGQARACFYAGRLEKAVALAEGRGDDPEALFWKGRALEKLGRLDGAVAALRRAAELGGESSVGRRARTELEFVEWRRGFLEDAPRVEKGGER